MIQRNLYTAVVTGPTGAIGTALCRRLLAENMTVYAICRPGSPRAAALPRHPGLHRVDCDAAALDTLPEFLADWAGNPVHADVFFHLAWAHTIGSGRNDMPAQIGNILHTVMAVRAAAKLGCRVFVGAGSQAEYGPVRSKLCPDTPTFPRTGYGMAKLCAGQMARAECRALGMVGIWARVLSVYGPHDGPDTMILSTIRRLLAGECPPLTAGEQLWDYLYAEDAAEALLRMARSGRDGAVYPLGSGRAYPLRRYIETLRDAINPALPLGFGQVPYGPDPVMYLQADLTALTLDTGFVPRTEFAQGIRRTIEWVREEAATHE